MDNDLIGRPDGRGGRRAGSGRKKLSEIEKAARAAARKAARRAAKSAGMTDADVARIASVARAFAAASTEDVIELAHRFSPNAMRVLALIAATGKSETARIAAASKIIAIGHLAALDADMKAVPLGKKELQLEAARLAVGAADWGDDLRPLGLKN